MSTISKGLQRSKIISQGDTNVPLVSQGLLNVHIHPNVAISISSAAIDVGNSFDIDVSYTLGSTGFNLTYEEQKLICDSQGNNICDDNGDDISSVFASNSSSSISVVVGSEQPVSPSRVVRTLTVTRNSAPIDGLPEKIIINFDNYMAQADITITQTAPPAITSISMTGGGITGTATPDNTSSSNRNQIEPSSTPGVATLTVNGEVGASYTLGENGNIFNVGSKTTVYTIPSGGTADHEVLIAAATDSSLSGAVFVDNDVTSARLQIYFVQPADNVPVLSITNQNLTDPIKGELVTGTINITNADQGGGTLVIQRPDTSSQPAQAVLVDADGNASRTFSLDTSHSSADGTWVFSYIDSGGNTGVFNLALDVTTPGFSGAFVNRTWDQTSVNLLFTLSSLSSVQLGRLDVSNFSTIQQSPSSPSRGTQGPGSYSANGFYGPVISDIPPYTSITGIESTTWRATLTIGSFVTNADYIINKSARPENPLTFPNGNLTILDTATQVSFPVRYDVATPTIVLTDASTTDDDIWTDSELGNATLGGASNPNISSDVNNIDFYLLQRNVTITGGSANITMSALVDMIRVTSS